MDKYRPKTAKILKPNNIFFSNVPKNNFQKTFFIQEKETGDKYFQTTRVGSCRKVVVKKWYSLCFNF